MIRKIIHIDEEKCDGCGACERACHEGAIAIIDGKAKLIRDDYCDGFGDCLPECHRGAIRFEEREALPYDREAVEENMRKAGKPIPPAPRPHHDEPCPSEPHPHHEHHHGGCPGSRPRVMVPPVPREEPAAPVPPTLSQLRNWPIQIKLTPVKGEIFEGAKLLIAADCTAYAYARFHEEFIRGKVTLIGCPKLDEADYSEKLTEIIRENGIKSVTIVRMEVPCCGGLERAAVTALKNSGKFIPWQVVTISIDGKILD